MTYLLRAILLWSAAFFLIYITLSIAVAGAWRFVRRRAANKTAESTSASFLYGLRVLPLTAAAALVVFVAVPSFLRLEPYQSGETVGLLGVLLGCAGIFVVCFGIASALFSLWKTRQFVASWSQTRSTQLRESGASVVEITAARPLLLVTGILRPRLLISEQVIQRLDEGEMLAALRHELAHARFHDNLKKLVLRLSRFPFLSELERRWMYAAEIAADDAAVMDESSAIDLASALLKLATPALKTQMPELATSLMPDTQEALSARIERLMAWQPRPDATPRNQWKTAFILAVLGLLVVGYAPLLHQVHELSELLIR